ASCPNASPAVPRAPRPQNLVCRHWHYGGGGNGLVGKPTGPWPDGYLSSRSAFFGAQPVGSESTPMERMGPSRRDEAGLLCWRYRILSGIQGDWGPAGSVRSCGYSNWSLSPSLDDENDSYYA